MTSQCRLGLRAPDSAAQAEAIGPDVIWAQGSGSEEARGFGRLWIMVWTQRSGRRQGLGHSFWRTRRPPQIVGPVKVVTTTDPYGRVRRDAPTCQTRIRCSGNDCQDDPGEIRGTRNLMRGIRRFFLSRECRFPSILVRRAGSLASTIKAERTLIRSFS